MTAEPLYGRYRVRRFGPTDTWLVVEVFNNGNTEASVAWCDSEAEADAEAKRLAAADTEGAGR